MFSRWNAGPLKEKLGRPAAFPLTTGFSPHNLLSAKQFYLAYADPSIWLQPRPGFFPIRVHPFVRG
jgi:hypothetical protein